MIKNKKQLFARMLLLVLFAFDMNPSSSARATDEIPGAPQTDPIALVGATIFPVNGEPIENGIIVFDEGVITQVGADIELPEGTEIINVEGKQIYPGMFEANSQIGVSEIGSVRETQDHSETGSYNPNVRTHVAVNPDSDVIPVTRSNGILLALCVPTSGVISGKSSVLQLDGWTYEEMTLQPQVALHMSWPRMTPRSSFRRPQSAEEQNRERDEQLEGIRDYFEQVHVYRHARETRPDLHPIDLKMEAMLPVIAGELPIIISADSLAQIQSAVAFAIERDLRIIIRGGFDAPRCAELLIENQIPVIVSAVYRRPLRSDEDYDSSYTLPNRLHEAGVTFCIAGSETSNARNLPYHAGTAVAYGLPVDVAIRSITLAPAEILGVDERVGSLEVGKDATLIVTDGNPLETFTDVSMAFIQGRRVDLSDKHKRLYDKYSERYRRINGE